MRPVPIILGCLELFQITVIICISFVRSVGPLEAFFLSLSVGLGRAVADEAPEVADFSTELVDILYKTLWNFVGRFERSGILSGKNFFLLHDHQV